MDSSSSAVQPRSEVHLVQPSLPLLQCIWLSFKIRAIKVLYKSLMTIVRYLKPAPFSERPTFSKAYPCRPHLQNRFFFPPSYTQGTLLPLYIDVHGGGWAIGTPTDDDDFCSRLASRFGVLVVSINYDKAPNSPYPRQIDDVEAICSAVIEDDALPVDKNRIFLGGFSAGGNLVLSAVQRSGLKELVKGVVGIFPSIDNSRSLEEKARLRRYKIPGEVDILRALVPTFQYAYLPAGTLLQDPQVSPSYAAQTDLPKALYIVSAELDIFVTEGRELMQHLAGIEKLSTEEENGFVKGGYKWTLVKDVEHGFMQIISKEDVEGRAKVSKVIDDVGQWLKEQWSV